MTDQERRRLQFLNAVQRYYVGTKARQSLQAEAIIQVLFSDRYDLQDARDVGVLLDNLEYTIDNELSPQLYDYVSEAMRTMSEMGANHTTEATASIIGNRAFDFMGLGDRLAVDYINRVGLDGKRLSERIWSPEAKEAITEQVFEGIRNRSTIYDVAQNIEKVVQGGRPMHLMERIAETELNYAYTHARADILLAEAEEFGANAYIEVSLSPAHNVVDICDAMPGIYPAQEAPLPPFHPNCLCITDSILLPKGKTLESTTISEQLKGNQDLITVDKLETHNDTVRLRD